MVEESKKLRHLMITKAIDELGLTPYFFRARHAYWEFDLGGSTLRFARNYIRNFAKYWEFREFDSSEDFSEPMVDVATPLIVMIGSGLNESIRKILNFLVYHLAQNAIFIFEKWNSGIRKMVEEFEDENPTIILKEIFSIYGYKAFQVRDL